MLPDIPIQYDAFISYARADGDDSASRLENALRPAFKTWRDTRGIDPAKDFTAEIEMAIRASKFVVTCITPDTARADSFVRREIQWALTINKPVIVARFDAATPPPIHVVNNTWVEFHKDWDTALTHLTGILRKEPDDYDRPALPPETADPFRPYVQAVYEYIVRFLDQAVIRLIDLTSEATTDAVHTPPAPVPARRGMMDQFFTAQGLPSPDSAGETAPTEEITTFTKFADAFEHYSGRVLLLGAPGAGKTITLFSHARETITRRLADPSAPLPLLGLVATWNAREQTPLADWLAAGYEDLPREEVARIIDVGRALLLLDGLDELGSEQEEERENPETG
ncbi:MAG: TIR domain-containing protein, partial [Anaerolineae bacterium]|nr:TIR domain-containing protein [Anaerolineae bacterium]